MFIYIYIYIYDYMYIHIDYIIIIRILYVQICTCIHIRVVSIRIAQLPCIMSHSANRNALNTLTWGQCLLYALLKQKSVLVLSFLLCSRSSSVSGPFLQRTLRRTAIDVCWKNILHPFYHNVWILSTSAPKHCKLFCECRQSRAIWPQKSKIAL